MPQERFYSEDEAEQILRLASRRASGTDHLTRERLEQAAAELGIRPEDLDAAEREMAEQRLREAEQREFRQHNVHEFLDSLSSWMGTGLLLLIINFMTTRFHPFWAIWPVGFWGLFVAREGVEAFFLKRIDPKEFDRWREKRARREAKRQQRELERGLPPA